MAFEDEILSRQMPHSLEAEQSALGSMLIDADCIKDVMDKLQPDDFYIRQNREIFETIYTMFSYSKAIDGITVAEEMQKNGTYDDQTTRNYLVQLMEITPTAANVMEYVKIIQDKSLLRSLAKSPPWFRRGWARRRISWKRPSRRFTPSGGGGGAKR